jgi:hypothetical protein
MSNKKETAVSWLISELTEYGLMHKDILPSHPIFKKAKEMEKQQIIDAITIGFDEGRSYMHNGTTKFETGFQYYTETYGGQSNEQ